MSNKNIVIIGLGGVGGYFGFKINQRNETTKAGKVTFVARGATYDKIKQDGLTLLSPEHPIATTRPDAIMEDIQHIQNPDLILICVKEYDLEAVCKELIHVINEDTVLLPLMNGADIYERIRRILPCHTILPACIYVASHIKEKGTVEHKGKAGKMIIGKDPEHPTADVSWIIALLSDSGVDVDFKDNALTDIWTKFAFIASFGLVTARYNSSLGMVCQDTLQKHEALQIIGEIKRIADKKMIALDSDIAEKTFIKAASFPFETPTSLQLDVHSGKAHNELELLGGAILRFGKELDIDTPCTQKIYTELIHQKVK